MYQLEEDQLKALVVARGESRGPFSAVVLPKFEVGMDFIFIHSFLDLMELHHIHQAMELTYIHNSVPQEWVDLLYYGLVRTMDGALHVLFQCFDPTHTPTDLRYYFTAIVQDAGVSLE